MSGATRTIGGVPFGQSALIAADWIRDRLNAFNVSFPAGNRLHRAQKLLKDVQAGKSEAG